MTTDFAGHAGANAAVVQDGRLVAAGFGLAGSSVDFALARYRRDGTLDRTFGTGGKVTTDFAGSGEQVTALVVQADGKLVAAGSATSGTGLDVALARYRRDGSLDPMFGTGGKVTTGFADVLGGDELVNALVVRDGKLVAAGSTITASGGQKFALARYR